MPERRTNNGLIIPGTVTSVEGADLLCLVCGDRFYRRELGKFERHIAEHARKGDDAELEAKADGARLLFKDADFDAEHAAYVKRTGMDRISEALRAEGRLDEVRNQVHERERRQRAVRR